MPKTTNYQIEKIAELLKTCARPVFHAPRGNRKLGEIPSFNIAPVVTCAACANRTCALEGCYAVKNMFAHGYNYNTNNVLRAWLDNTLLAFTDLDALEAELDAVLTLQEQSISAGKFFRMHSSGDFFSVAYAQMWERLIAKHPGIKFLAFTKQFDVVRAVDFSALANISLVLSGWPGVEIPEDLKSKYRVAYCVDHGDAAPTGAIECPGNCDTCGMCWNLAAIGRDVYFNKH